MKMVKVRWVVVIFVLLGFLIIGTESLAINPELNTLLRRDATTACVQNKKNVTLTTVTLQLVICWYDKDQWRAEFKPIKTWKNLGKNQLVCTKVNPGTYRVQYQYPGRGIEIRYTSPKQVLKGQKYIFYCD